MKKHVLTCWDERAEKDFAVFMDSKKKHMNGFLIKLEYRGNCALT